MFPIYPGSLDCRDRMAFMAVGVAGAAMALDLLENTKRMAVLGEMGEIPMAQWV